MNDPESFKEDALRADLASGRLSHAVLLSGRKGIGKKTLAHELARGVLCEAEGRRPCGVCGTCRRYLSRTLPDLMIPAPRAGEKTLKVESIRAVVDQLASAPVEGRRRAVVIENAERMTPQAQNVLLKTVEEVDPATWFFLTADTLNGVLPTILSRCRVCRMPPWSDDRLLAALAGKGIPPEEARRLVPLSAGAIGKALEIHADPSFFAALETVKNTFFAVRRPSDIPAALKLLRDAVKDKKDQEARLLEILEDQVDLLIRRPDASEAPESWRDADESSLRRILEAVLRVKAQRASNVGFTGCAENLLSVISEETKLWQL